MTYLTRRYRFSASHRLFRPEFSAEENDRLYGKCNNEGGHGHNYRLEVTVGGAVDPQTGMVLNLVELDGVVGSEVLERFDHVYLNADKECFGEKVPTAENLCVEVFNRLKGKFNGAALKRVRLEETSKNSFEYRGNYKEGNHEQGKN